MSNLNSLNATQLATLYVLLNKAGADTQMTYVVWNAGLANCGLHEFEQEVNEAWKHEASQR